MSNLQKRLIRRSVKGWKCSKSCKSQKPSCMPYHYSGKIPEVPKTQYIVVRGTKRIVPIGPNDLFNVIPVLCRVHRKRKLQWKEWKGPARDPYNRHYRAYHRVLSYLKVVPLRNSTLKDRRRVRGVFYRTLPILSTLSSPYDKLSLATVYERLKPFFRKVGLSSAGKVTFL